MNLKKRIAKKLAPFVDKYCPIVPVTLPTPVIKETIPYERMRCVVALEAQYAEGIVKNDAGPLKSGALFFRDATYERAREHAVKEIVTKLISDKFIKFELSEDGTEYRASMIAVRPDDIKDGRKRLEAEFVPTKIEYQRI